MKKITLDQLIEKGACFEQVSMFKQYFGSEVEVTIEGAIKVALNFNWNWAAENLLSKEQLTYYNSIIQPAQEAYKAAAQSAWEAYLVAIQPAQEAYKAVEQPAWEVYEAAIQPAQEAYKAAIQPALEAYNRSRAEAFAKVYSLD